MQLEKQKMNYLNWPVFLLKEAGLSSFDNQPITDYRIYSFRVIPTCVLHVNGDNRINRSTI